MPRNTGMCGERTGPRARPLCVTDPPCFFCRRMHQLHSRGGKGHGKRVVSAYDVRPTTSQAPTSTRPVPALPPCALRSDRSSARRRRPTARLSLHTRGGSTAHEGNGASGRFERAHPRIARSHPRPDRKAAPLQIGQGKKGARWVAVRIPTVRNPNEVSPSETDPKEISLTRIHSARRLAGSVSFYKGNGARARWE